MVSSHRILHLSDTHATASGFDEDGVDALASLDQVLHDCRHLSDLDLVVLFALSNAATLSADHGNFGPHAPAHDWGDKAQPVHELLKLFGK